jgi:hypothetical protein
LAPEKIKLEPRTSIVGAETRLLMAECKGPSFPNYTLEDAKRCMELMHLVLRNRLSNNPGQFGAKHARTIVDIIKARGQFKGFENYPNYNPAIVTMLQSILDIANSANDSRHADFADFVNTAIAVAQSESISDPSGGIAVAWRTANSGSPGSNFVKFETVGGNDFYRLK